MSKLRAIYEALQNKVNDGEITIETATQVLNKAKSKYVDESVGDLKCGGECCASTPSTSKDAPDLPDETRTGEGVTDGIDRNSTSSIGTLLKLAKLNKVHALDDADGEEDKDTTINADDLTESVVKTVDAMRLRVYEDATSGVIDEDTKDILLDYLNLDNYTYESDDDYDDTDDIDDSDDESTLDAIINTYNKYHI